MYSWSDSPRPSTQPRARDTRMHPCRLGNRSCTSTGGPGAPMSAGQLVSCTAAGDPRAFMSTRHQSEQNCVHPCPLNSRAPSKLPACDVRMRAWLLATPAVASMPSMAMPLQTHSVSPAVAVVADTCGTSFSQAPSYLFSAEGSLAPLHPQTSTSAPPRRRVHRPRRLHACAAWPGHPYEPNRPRNSAPCDQ